MLEVMREEIDQQPYEWFCELCIRGYLAIRYYIVNIYIYIYIYIFIYFTPFYL